MREPKFWMKVWDLPTRLFHWAVVLLIFTSWLTWREHQFVWHVRAGEAMLILLLFRLIWGFVGSETSLFRQFLRSPLAGFRHLAHFFRREPDTEIGHNAAGGWMVLVMLGVILLQVVLGLLATSRKGAQGPLAHLISPELSHRLGYWHSVNFNVILGVVGLHVVAVLAYAIFKRQDLVRPMITGRKRLPGRLRAPRMQGPVMAGAVLALSAMLVWVLVTRI